MKYVNITFLITVFWVLACGPTAVVKVSGVENSDATTTGDVTDDALKIADGDGWDASPQKFEPRSIPYKQRDKAMVPNISSMPALQLRLRECYGIGDEKESSLSIAGSGVGGGGMGLARGGSVKSSETHRRSSSGKKKSSVARSKTKSAGEGMDSLPASSAPAAEVVASQSAPHAEPSKAEASEQSMDMTGASEEAEMEVATSEESLDEYENWGAAIYLSNDDSMSLSSAQRVMYAIDNFLPLPEAHIRPHELLNYFTFDTAEVANGHDFSVYPDMMADATEPGNYTLGMAISARPVSKETRRNVALTWVVDRSGSMMSEGRMEYLKRGLRRSLGQLKRGDMVHMVLFDHNVCTPVENFVVGRDDISELTRAIDALRPLGSTDLHSGLREGYRIADRSYQGHHSNRVVLITDALTNTGVVDTELISMISKYYDTRRIRLSGVGVGREFNDALLDGLTEKGKGAYVFLGSEAEVDAIFGQRFISLIETVALDVHFRLHLPKSLRMNVFYGEESSVYKEDVQAIHYFANTSQLFLSDLIARGGKVRPQDDIMLTIEYQDPESGNPLVEEYAFNLKKVMENDPYNSRKGKVIIAWIDMLAVMAARTLPTSYSFAQSAWRDDEAYGMCEDGTNRLNQLSRGLETDPEVKRVNQLWEKYCMRYSRPESQKAPTLHKRTPQWPGAIPEETR